MNFESFVQTQLLRKSWEYFLPESKAIAYQENIPIQILNVFSSMPNSTMK